MVLRIKVTVTSEVTVTCGERAISDKNKIISKNFFLFPPTEECVAPNRWTNLLLQKESTHLDYLIK
jgi:hypothetical protein